MRLQDGDRSAVMTRCGRFTHHQIPGAVRTMGQPETLSHTLHVGPHPILGFGRTGNRENRIEVPPERGRLEITDKGHESSQVSI